MRHGGGDLDWFHKLGHEQQVAVLAATRARQPASKGTASGRAFWGVGHV